MADQEEKGDTGKGECCPPVKWRLCCYESIVLPEI
jgi:hypothetical protein